MFDLIVPPWAVAAGVPPPKQGESFEAWAERASIPAWVVAYLLEGLEERTMPVLNARLASYLLTVNPIAFSRAVAELNQEGREREERRQREIEARNLRARRAVEIRDLHASVLSERYS